MSRPEFRHAAWRTSSRSHGNGDCVEVAAAGALVGVRDSKDPAGPVLVVDPTGWAAFLAGIQGGELG